ncbi:hypothetical protein DWB77_04098 [Streptomyces hundungensis]|uniref:Uncharacterized protein n=1 Tax=Streptomyces hundungensis TaxID=1077946 RepID=A0A387HGZ5_9ACTN|nr:DUF6087 family protein [Streptomyces hundungensis]AYG81931.1 hypothetical protein DWB77_04098 [Streptomyces hundungensis]
MVEEPLSEWAERRDSKIGRLRAVPIVSGNSPKGSHVSPDAPRAIERWNGHAWEPYGFATSLAETKRILFPEANKLAAGSPGLAGQPLAPGRGRHRKP